MATPSGPMVRGSVPVPRLEPPTLRTSEPSPFNPSHRVLLTMVIVGMLAVVGLPLSASTPLAAGLVFATPVLLAIVGRVRDLAWLRSIASLLLAVLAVAMVVVWLPLSVLAVVVLFLGPAVAAVTVGVPLQGIDRGAALAFFGCGALAVVVGFVTANLASAPFLVVGIGAVGVVLVVRRLRGD